MQFIDSTNFERLLKKLSSEGELFVPVTEEDTGKLHIERVETFPLPEAMSVEGYRTVETLKGFAQFLRSTVAEYPSEELDELEADENAPSCIVVGARACDITAMELVDKVQVEGEFEDPFYRIRREKIFTIAADCTDCGESCFCTLLGRKPWPEKGYDLTISKVDAGYLIEAGSDRGEKIISENGDLFTAPRRPGEGQGRVSGEGRRETRENKRGFPRRDKDERASQGGVDRRALGRGIGKMCRVRSLYQYLPDLLLLPAVRYSRGREVQEDDVLGQLPGHRILEDGRDG